MLSGLLLQGHPSLGGQQRQNIISGFILVTDLHYLILGSQMRQRNSGKWQLLGQRVAWQDKVMKPSFTSAVSQKRRHFTQQALHHSVMQVENSHRGLTQINALKQLHTTDLTSARRWETASCISPQRHKKIILIFKLFIARFCGNEEWRLLNNKPPKLLRCWYKSELNCPVNCDQLFSPKK